MAEQLTFPHNHGDVVIVNILKFAVTVPEGFMFFSQQIMNDKSFPRDA